MGECIKLYQNYIYFLSFFSSREFVLISTPCPVLRDVLPLHHLTSSPPSSPAFSEQRTAPAQPPLVKCKCRKNKTRKFKVATNSKGVVLGCREGEMNYYNDLTRLTCEIWCSCSLVLALGSTQSSCSLSQFCPHSSANVGQLFLFPLPSLMSTILTDLLSSRVASYVSL